MFTNTHGNSSASAVVWIIPIAIILAVFAAAAIARCLKKRRQRLQREQNATADIEAGGQSFINHVGGTTDDASQKKPKKKGTVTAQESAAGFVAGGFAYGFGTVQ